jgi:hypothetical protein
MGGFGSGRREYATTPTVRQCYSLPADEFTEVIDGPHGGRLSLSWTDNVDISVFIKNDTDGPADALQFVYVSDPDGEAIKNDYEVSLSYTEPHFGGVRPWFLCPECNDRVGKLHLPPTGYRFACRSCHELGYLSSRQSGLPVKRAIERYKDAFQKADDEGRRPHPEHRPWFPTKPKHMHTETFDELLAELKARETEFYEAWDNKARELVERLQQRDY